MLGYARDRRLKRTFDHLLEIQHEDGGWRCNRVRMGKSPETDASNPGVTLAALDAFRFSRFLNQDRRLDKAVRSLLAHCKIRMERTPEHDTLEAFVRSKGRFVAPFTSHR